MSQVSAKEQTMMWQQNSYLGDSGINSGVTTQAPSLTGKEEEMMSYPPSQAPRPSKLKIFLLLCVGVQPLKKKFGCCIYNTLL